MPTLFKKYMQVGADTARKYGGTGLGLAICKQLVSSHTERNVISDSLERFFMFCYKESWDYHVKLVKLFYSYLNLVQLLNILNRLSSWEAILLSQA